MRPLHKLWYIPVVALISGIGVAASSPPHQLDCEGDEFEPTAAMLLDWPNTDFCQFKYASTEFRSGGPPRDGIPPLYPEGYVYPDEIVFYGGDEPIFTVAYETINEADAWLPDQNPVLAVEINGQARAYPLEILTRHEIANTTIGDMPVAVTFCPLCNTGIVFERVIDEQEFHFGVSGFLRNSDMVMWDHETESWWQQATGEAVVGAMTGQRLKFVTSSMVSWADFKNEYPDGLVLSSQGRDYDYNPYAGYDSADAPFLYNGYFDERLPAMERVFGYEAGEGENTIAVAYPFNLLQENIVVEDVVVGQPIVVFWQPGAVSALDSSTISESKAVGATAIYDRTLADGTLLNFATAGTTIMDTQTGSTWNIFGRAVSGELEGTQLTHLVGTTHFWFAWTAFQPETLIWQPGILSDNQPSE